MLLAIAKSVLGIKSDDAVPYTDQSDEDLMIAFGEGDADAFEVLFKRHERGIYNFVLRSVGRADLAEELTQDVFMRIIKSAPKYTTSAKFTTWAYTIARNICIDRARKKGGKHELSLDKNVSGDEGEGRTFLDNVADESNTGASSYDRKQFRERLAKALDDLPEDQREVFIMRHVTGLKFREISEVLDIPLPTVKSRMRYALEALRGHLAMYKGQSFDEDDREANVPTG